MPLYEYECVQCKERFEKLIRGGVTEEDLRCPACGSTSLKRLVSLFGAVGTGQANCVPSLGSG